MKTFQWVVIVLEFLAALLFFFSAETDIQLGFAIVLTFMGMNGIVKVKSK